MDPNPIEKVKSLLNYENRKEEERSKTLKAVGITTNKSKDQSKDSIDKKNSSSSSSSSVEGLDQEKLEALLRALIEHFDSENFKLPDNLKDYNETFKPNRGSYLNSRPNSSTNSSTTSTTTSSSSTTTTTTRTTTNSNNSKRDDSEDLKLLGLTEWEKCSILNRESLIRCLKADRFEIEKTINRLEETLVWRRDFGCDVIDIDKDSESIKKEAETGKMFVLGFDNLSRPVVHMRPRNQNKVNNLSTKRLQFAFWLIDRAIDLMPPGVESILLVIDLAGPQESPSVKQQRDFVRSLGAHYCERLGQALVLNMPSVFVWILKLVKPFIDPITFSKAIFDRADPLKFAPKDQLDSSLGGTSGYEFDIESYWPALMEECSKRRKERLDRWKINKKRIGCSEIDEIDEKDENENEKVNENEEEEVDEDDDEVITTNSN